MDNSKKRQNALDDRKRCVNMRFTTSGSGSVNTVIGIPSVWCDVMGITKDDKGVTLTFDGDKVTLTKTMEK